VSADVLDEDLPRSKSAKNITLKMPAAHINDPPFFPVFHPVQAGEALSHIVW